MSAPLPPNSHREPDGDAPPRRSSKGTYYAIGVVVVAAVVALVAVLLTRPPADGSGGDGGSAATTTAAPTPTTSRPPSAGEATSAATMLGWGQPSRVEEFDGPRPPGWDIYSGEGHNGQGTRTPNAIDVQNGLLTIKGDAEGNTGGLAMMPGQKYGRWEGRMRMPTSDPTYHALMLLWPDKENWPVGGEIDFVEATSPDRQSVNSFLHYGKSNKQVQNNVNVDATQWHNWAVEWTPDHVIGYLDGREWYRIDDKDTLPPGPMHLCLQFDWFPDDGDRNNVTPSEMQVDWVKEYKLS
ncbi:hypothetical protein GCM10009836_06990 [Pseudonocardia ailaonensis]|uniref:GH16 domain-containing protein n=1 Tax=Pseudonocardia ailaonensis TaxID=367279 RepID=A0ABN2MLL0_9PSEU